MSEPTRAQLRWLARVVGGLAGLALAGLLVSILMARHALETGIDRAQEGLDSARAGESDDAADRLEAAGRAFRSAHGPLGAWWAQPARLLPIVGQHLRALEMLSAEGSDLAATTATATRAARVQDLKVTQGRLDLDRVRATAAPLATISTAIDEARTTAGRADSPWLLAPVANRLDEFRHSLEAAAADAATASEAIAVLPDMLGGSGRRFYFVAFGTPAEARDLGGFMGAYAILVADEGKVFLGVTGRVRDLNRYSKGRELDDPSAFPAHFLALRPQKFWQNITGTADFPTTAAAVEQMWPPIFGHLDGAFYMDPQALATLLDLTGPVSVPGYDKPLTRDTAAPFLLRDQYVIFPEAERKDFLVEAARTVFRELIASELPGPRELADTLAPAVHERRLLLNSFRPREQALLERLHLDGGLPPVDGDFLSVRASNRGLSKIDAFMQRSIIYDVSVDPRTSTVHATLTVTVRNDAPGSGLPDTVIGNRLGEPSGTNSTTVAVYSPLDLVDVTQNGRSVPRAAAPEYGRSRYSALLDVPPGRSVTVVFELTGTIDLRGGYHLDVVPQPLVNPDRVRVEVHGPPGWASIGKDILVKELLEDEALDVSFSPFAG